MGCDIHGWVEVQPWSCMDSWEGFVKAGILMPRGYDMFGSLFGVRNYANFKPIAERRGMPTDVSDEAGKEWERYREDFHSASWILLSEINKIDWEEKSEVDDSRIHQYKKNKDGTLKYEGKFAMSSRLEGRMNELIEKRELKIKDQIYKLEKIKRKDCICSRWETLFKLMRILAEEYGEEKVRLVVWFDN